MKTGTGFEGLMDRTVSPQNACAEALNPGRLIWRRQSLRWRSPQSGAGALTSSLTHLCSGPGLGEKVADGSQEAPSECQACGH